MLGAHGRQQPVASLGRKNAALAQLRDVTPDRLERHVARDGGALRHRPTAVGAACVAGHQRRAASRARATLSGRRPWAACRRPFTLVYVTANGNVLPCCIAPFATRHYPGIVLGNVFERPLAEIWNGERYREFRRAILTESPPECCSGCGVKWSL